MDESRHQFFNVSNEDILELQSLLDETNCNNCDSELNLSINYKTDNLKDDNNNLSSLNRQNKEITKKISKKRNGSLQEISLITANHNSNKLKPIDIIIKDSSMASVINDDNNDLNTIKHVISDYKLSEKLYGIEKIIMSAKHDPKIHPNKNSISNDSLMLNSVTKSLCEQQVHYHFLVKFNTNYYEMHLKGNNELFSILSDIKIITIDSIKQYNDCIHFMINLNEPLKITQSDECSSSKKPRLQNIHIDEYYELKSNSKSVSRCSSSNSNDSGTSGSSSSSINSINSKNRQIDSANFILNDHNDDDDDDEITLDELNELKEKAKLANNVKLMQSYLEKLNSYNKQQETKKTFNEIIEKEKPLNDYEYEVLRYDFDMRMSVFRACHLLDLIDLRNKVQSKADTCAIYILYGEKNCGKSKIAYHVANTIGKCSFPLVAYTYNDKNALSEWYETGSDVIVFEDFDFLSATDPKKPEKIFNNLKKWASGQEIYFSPASKLSKHLSNTLRSRKIKAIFICINKTDNQLFGMLQKIPEIEHLQFEYLLFGHEYSYNPEMNKAYLNIYPDSCSICDKSMYKFLKHYQKCKLDSNLNGSSKGFKYIRKSFFPLKYPYSIELYSTDYKRLFNNENISN